MSVRLIDFKRLAVYEAGALLVTLLAFPDASDETQGNVQASLCNYALKVRSAIEHDWTILPQPIKPFYAFRSECDCNRDLQTLVRRWRDRMVAGRMGIAFLKEALPGQVLELPATVKRLSINQLAELVLDDTQFTDPHNVETRIWRPSRPVVHLASVIQVYLTLRAPDRKLSNRLLIELDMGLQPTFHTIYCGGDRYRTHSRAVFGGGAVSR